VRRLWARDASLWTGADEASWLRWLGIAEDQVGRIDRLRRVADGVRREGFTRALLLGMGGSSLCPEVLKETFGRIDGFPEVLVLDSTDPTQIRAFERKVDVAKTLFIVSSKSGSTLEPNIFKQYFFERARQVVGAERAGGLTDEYEKTGKLPPESPTLVSDRSLAATLRAHLGTIEPGHYVAILAYIEMNAAHEAELQAIRRAVRDRYRVATCVGFGPRFLHSTGQAYKGGPNTGVFLQITCDDAADLAMPGQAYTFGVVKAAQARGDLQVLVERGRRALRIHLDTEVRRGLQTLRSAVEQAIG